MRNNAVAGKKQLTHNTWVINPPEAQKSNWQLRDTDRAGEKKIELNGDGKTALPKHKHGNTQAKTKEIQKTKNRQRNKNKSKLQRITGKNFTAY